MKAAQVVYHLEAVAARGAHSCTFRSVRTCRAVDGDPYAPCQRLTLRLASGSKILAKKAAQVLAHAAIASCEAGGGKKYSSTRRVITTVEHQHLSLSKRVREDPYTNCSCTKQKAAAPRGALGRTIIKRLL